MSEPTFQRQVRQWDTILNINNNYYADKDSLFPKLQYPLSQIECEKTVVQRICNQLVSEGIFDAKVLNKYFLPDSNYTFRDLVWMFHNEEHEDFLKFLNILTHLEDLPVLRGKFRKVIHAVMPLNSAGMEKNFGEVPRTFEKDTSQVLIKNDTVVFTQSKGESNTDHLIPSEDNVAINDIKQDSISVLSGNANNNTGLSCDDQADEVRTEEWNKFIDNSENKTENLILKTSNVWPFQKTITTVALIIGAGALATVLGISLYFNLRPAKVHEILEWNSTTTLPISFTEDLHKFTTIDPNIVEIKVNESFYSYNFT